MNNVLSSAGLEVLREYIQSEVLLAFDYDGTLAPIVEDADHAYMGATTRDLMWQVAQHYPVIVITGRAQPDALRRVRGVGIYEVVGNHGIEPRYAANRYAEQVRCWRPVLDACAAAWPGIVVEDKIFSIAVHYRQALEPERARISILEAAATLEDARVIGGKMVVNIVPRGGVDKGTALERERQHMHCSRAIYVGDDETDEDVFSRAQPGQLLGIRVGESATSAASHFIPDQSAIDALLRLFISLRAEPASRSGRFGSAPEE
jgi:trehalose 6-phosphate phosphatase